MQRRHESKSNLNVDELIKSLTDNFNVLADEFELHDREVQILRAKLRFSLDQYQQLAAKYASPGNLDITNTIARLQLPSDLHDPTGFVPLPSRKQISSSQQTADAIKEGRRASRRLSILHGWKNTSSGSTSGTSGSGRSNALRASRATSLSTVLEQDFTVPGRKSDLACPFATALSLSYDKTASDYLMTPSTNADPTPHKSSDPICAAMYPEGSQTPSVVGSAAAAKCPIRFLDRHSPEEVAQYFETHKHEIPRSHEVCVKRYQRNEEDIRKLDAKYGNLVSMLQGLAPIHQPMLPTSEQELDAEHGRRSNERVQNWATTISIDGLDKDEEDGTTMNPEDDRESRFDRPLKEVRLGESPSRPWGISVPFSAESRPSSQPAEISPSFERSSAYAPPFPQIDSPRELASKCPLSAAQGISTVQGQPTNQCPFKKGKKAQETEAAKAREQNQTAPQRPISHLNATEGHPLQTAQTQTQVPSPTFIQPHDINKQAANGIPQMVFTGPVFIGYPIEQAMAFMQQYQGGAGR